MPRYVASVVLEGATGSFDKQYDYLIPEKLLPLTAAGQRVIIPFGRSNLKKQGMILSVKAVEDERKLKPISELTDAKPILSDEMLKMCVWLKNTTFCTYFDAIHSMLPAGLNYRLIKHYSENPEFASHSLLSDEEAEVLRVIASLGDATKEKLSQNFNNVSDILISLEKKGAVLFESTAKRRMLDATSKYVRLKEDINLSDFKLTKRQLEIAEVLEASGAVSIKELQYFTGVSQSVINSLEKSGVAETFENEEFRTPIEYKTVTKREEINLTAEQENAFLGINALTRSNEFETALLYGVTGSGKTKVFLRLVDEVSNSGRGVIIMVPEIALTPQMINIFCGRYGDKIAVFHSAMSMGKRMDEYKRIKQGKALIAIGTRSAIFAPFNDLGLIIIDEEQEHTYKSEKSPRFHTRDLAKFRAAYHKGVLCLASATPSLESYSLAKSGKYKLFTLKNRYGNAELPSVTVVDMKKEILEGNSSGISRELSKAIDEELSQNKQIILLLNRRGHNTYISCPECGYVASCPNCSVSLTYHSANKRLMCHYCGHSEPISNKCPECSGEHLKFMGLGTQKIEEDLKRLYPNARVLRLDADSTLTRDSYSKYLSAFSRGEYDIMLGTQMVAKGLDFPNVSLVGVIGADRALYSDDYRGYERTFALLTQVVGRAGRAGSGGRAIIQTVDPENQVISLAKEQNYDAFYEQEILSRRLMTYPPYCDICLVWTQSSDNSLAEDTIREIFGNIKENLSNEYKDLRLTVLGPNPASVVKVNQKYRYRMIIKCKNTKAFREMLKKSTDVKLKRDATVSVDINPENVI